MTNCPTLIKLPFSDKSDVNKAKGLCFGCLKPGHLEKVCRNKATSEHCCGQHQTVMHTPDRQNSQLPRSEQTKVHLNESKASTDNRMNQQRMGSTEEQCTMAKILVKVRTLQC